MNLSSKKNNIYLYPKNMSSKKINNHFDNLNTIAFNKKFIVKSKSYLGQGYHAKNNTPKDNSTYFKNSTFLENESIIQNNMNNQNDNNSNNFASKKNIITINTLKKALMIIVL